MPVGKMVDEKVIVNGLVALLATGGSTNLTMHIVAMAKAAGIIINWDDISDLSTVVPLLSRIYPQMGQLISIISKRLVERHY